DRAAHPALREARPARIPRQARAPHLRRRPAGQGFLPPPPRRRRRDPGDLLAPLGADARAARPARADVRRAGEARLAVRPAAGRGLQVRADPQARGVARANRRGAAASERPAHRRGGERRQGGDKIAASGSERCRRRGAIHPHLFEIRMNQGLLSVDEALARLLAEAKPVADVEQVPTLEATNRILAHPQTSSMDVPPMDNSAMDGYAVSTRDSSRLKVAQKIMAGSVGEPLEKGTAARIFTGAPIPQGADAVVMQEHCIVEKDFVVLKKTPKPGEWIRLVGSDVKKGGEILPAGKRLLPQDTGLAASVGIKALPVFRKIRLGLFFTG